MELKIVFAGNTTLIGRYEEGAYPAKGILHEPRAIAVGADKQGRTMVGMSNLVGLPTSLEIVSPSIMYDVQDQDIINLYVKTTTNLAFAKDLSNVRPIRP